MNTAEITKKYREDIGLSLAQFAMAINTKSRSVSRQAVHQWETGETVPSLEVILSVRSQYAVWRYDWAQDYMALMYPSLS